MIRLCLAKNWESPYNEDVYIAAYKKANPRAESKDGYDIACVVNENKVPGHALMKASKNRSKDTNYHWVYDFIPDYELRLYI